MIKIKRIVIDMSCILQRISDAYQRNPAEVLSLLPELMDAVKAGEVIELPCKVGDIVYAEGPFYKADFVPINYHIEPWEIQHIGITVKCDGWERRIPFDEIGKTVFFTRKEAEKAIERKWRR